MTRLSAWLLLVIFVSLVISPRRSTAAPDAALYYHWEGGHSPYKYVTVEIAPDGLTKCSINYYGREIASTLQLTLQEKAFFEAQFEKVVSLARQEIELMAVDTATTIWRLTKDGETKELSYMHTQNPWAINLRQAMWAFVHNRVALQRLLSGTAEEAYRASSDIQSDLREAVLQAAGRWPYEGISFWRNHATMGNYLLMLSYCEPKEQWAGDVMGLYDSKPAAAQQAMLRALANQNFLSTLEEERRPLLVPLMLRGIANLLAQPDAANEKEIHHVCSEVIFALSELRDGRALELLSSDKVWNLRGELDLATTSARALSKLGLPGAKALLDKADSPDSRIRRIARAELKICAQTFAFDSGITPKARQPRPEQVAELRRFLAELGYSNLGIDSLDLPEAAAKALGDALPGWVIMETAAFFGGIERFISTETDSRAGPQRCRGDFDGNGHKDIALLLRKDDRVSLVVLRQLSETQWAAQTLVEMPFQAGLQSGYRGFTLYITSVPPSTLSFWPRDAQEKSGRLELATDGIALHFHEKASTLFFWDKNGFSKAISGY